MKKSLLFLWLLGITFRLLAETPPSVSHWQLVKNEGQWESPFLYRAQLPNAWFYLHQNGYTLKINDPKEQDFIREKLHHKQFKLDSSFSLNYHAIRFTWLNTKGSDSLISVEKQPFYHNYFLGNNPEKWKGNVEIAKSLGISNLYPGVDWHLTGKDLLPKHELHIAPFQSTSQIAFTIEGADSFWINKQGDLIIKTSLGWIKESKPISWQIIKGKKQFIKCAFELNKEDNSIKYKLGQYNPSLPLVIDPLLVFSTYSGSVGDNFGFTATYDSRGNLYAGGVVDGDDGDYPTTIGAFQMTYGGSPLGQFPVNLPCDMSISKYSSDGTSLLYATYLGGNQNEHPHSLVVDKQDNLIVFGTSNSTNFPIDSLGYDTSSNGGYDIVLVKLSTDGSTMLGGTFLGGRFNDGINDGALRFNYADDFRGDVYVDQNNQIFLATCSKSFDFPTTGTKTFQGNSDALVLSMDSSLQQLLWSNFYGGLGEDAAYSVKVIDTMVFVAGGTTSPQLYQGTYNGGTADGFLTRLNITTGEVNSFNYFGTPFYDQVYFIDFDSKKNIYFSGQTQGAISRTAGTYGQDNTGQFIGKYSFDLDTILLLTTFGTRTASSGNNRKPDLSPSAFLVDKCDNIYFSGWGSRIFGENNNGSTFGLPVSADAIQKTTDNNDFYLIVLSRELKKLAYATYFGGTQSEDHVDGGTSRFDKEGIIYQSVCASCPSAPGQFFVSDFLTTPGVIFPQNLSRRCSNAAFKIDFQVTKDIVASFEAEPKRGCSPLEVKFNNTSNGGISYYWDFGDGNTDTSRSPSHSYKKEGIYRIKLIVFDEFTCNVIDSAFDTIQVLGGAQPSFEVETQPCDLEVTIKNTTNEGYSPIWYFGNGDSSLDLNPKYRYPFGGMYKITLKIIDNNSDCPDTASKIITFPANPFSDPQIPNVFTPNNDNLNDCYRILGLSEECEKGKLMIYNRWGDVVFEGEVPQECWNGKFKNQGNELPEGVYYYLLVTDRNGNPGITVHGVVHLIRGK